MCRSLLMLLLGVFIAPASSDEAGLAAPDSDILRFSGEVGHGKSFEHALWNGLRFILKATDDGWEISVTDGTNQAGDFVWVATPPYRFDNPRYLGTVYGHSAADVVAWTPRRFSFVLSRDDYSAAEAAVHQLLWPYRLSEAAIQAAEERLPRLSRGNGVLKIVGAKLSDETGDGIARIESLSFAVEIRPPVDPRAALHQKFLLESAPEHENVEEACPSVAVPIQIGKTTYHDFDGDGFDEAVVLAYSCVSGTGGADLPGVFTRSAAGEVRELEVGEIPKKDPKLREGLRGKMDLKVENGTLVKEFPIYRDNDPNCCPTGGVRRFAYRWDGKGFVMDKVENVAVHPSR